MGCNSIADVLRRMDDEDLACFIICPVAGEASCEKPPEACYKCCLDWLRRPAWALNKWKKDLLKLDDGRVVGVLRHREKMDEYYYDKD